jgi:putative ABC transport system permease protein
LTILGVFIGVIIIIGVASVLNGFRAHVVERIESFGTNNVYVSRMPGIQLSRPAWDIRHRKDLTLNDAWAVRDQCPAVEAISPAFADEKSEDLKYAGRESLSVPIRGAFPSVLQVLGLNLQFGRFFTDEENRRRVPVAVIGATLAESLFPTITPLDKQVILKGQRFRVIGVFEKSKGDPFGGENPDDSMFCIPYYCYKQFYPWERDHKFAVRAERGRLLDAIQQIEEVLRRRRHIAWHAPNDFEIATADSFIETFDRIVFATMAVMFALSSVAFMVGGVGVMNIMLASVKERTREIGLRRALGARRRDITWQFLIEAMALTGLGGILGITLGEILMSGIAHALPQLPVAVPVWARVFGLFGSIGVGLVFGLWPALSAARLDPIQALRYE